MFMEIDIIKQILRNIYCQRILNLQMCIFSCSCKWCAPFRSRKPRARETSVEKETFKSLCLGLRDKIIKSGWEKPCTSLKSCKNSVKAGQLPCKLLSRWLRYRIGEKMSGAGTRKPLWRKLLGLQCRWHLWEIPAHHRWDHATAALPPPPAQPYPPSLRGHMPFMGVGGC